MHDEHVTSDIDQFTAALPDRVREWLLRHGDLDNLIEVVIDLGRPIEARFTGGFEIIEETPALRADLDYVIGRVGDFDRDNRAGVEATLHRISAIRNRHGEVVGLTCRVGRAVFGTIDIIRDMIETGRNILMVGRPGVGKTTRLREVARVLADEFDKRVVVVDTNNEIGGDGDVPHPAIGRARRMQVPHDRQQYQVMIEAVENHMPEVIVIDEIGTEEEAAAARTIAERGVQLIATAHGNSLDNLMSNPMLEDLIGGIQAVTLGDDEAKRRGTQKTVLERKAPPTFDTLIEIADMHVLAIHHDVAEAVDALLLGAPVTAEIRQIAEDGSVITSERPVPRLAQAAEAEGEARELDALELELRQAERHPRVLRVLAMDVSCEHIERAARELRLPITTTEDVAAADVVITTDRGGKTQDVPETPLGTIAVRSDTYTQVADAVASLADMHRDDAREEFALREAAEAADRVIADGVPIELLPQSAYIRRLQRELLARRRLQSRTVGEDPRRRVRVLPP
ncbi:MAG: AAA family ATPase [Armatimonadetes bacterium]|nr:AAA family ATPase [Armatimonadota bacterium]